MFIIRHDWMLHFFYGNVIATAMMVFVSVVQPFLPLPLSLDQTLPLWTSLASVVGAGAFKEYLDRDGRGHVEFSDFVWTVAGWLSPAAVWFLA